MKTKTWYKKTELEKGDEVSYSHPAFWERHGVVQSEASPRKGDELALLSVKHGYQYVWVAWQRTSTLEAVTTKEWTANLIVWADEELVSPAKFKGEL